MKSKPKAKATKLHVTANRTTWRIDMPGVQGRTMGATYRAFTYPDSDLIYLETWVKEKRVSELVAGRIIARTREAIERAQEGGKAAA